MNKLFPIVLALMFFGCGGDEIREIKYVLYNKLTFFDEEGKQPLIKEDEKGRLYYIVRSKDYSRYNRYKKDTIYVRNYNGFDRGYISKRFFNLEDYKSQGARAFNIDGHLFEPFGAIRPSPNCNRIFHYPNLDYYEIVLKSGEIIEFKPTKDMVVKYE